MSLEKSEGAVLPQEGSRESRVPVAPAAARVVVVSTRVSHHRFTGTPGLPCAMGYGLFRALPGDRLDCHRHPQEACKKLASRELDASVGASGPHDFAVRAQCHSSLDMPRPSHPAPNVRDDRETPLCVGRDGERCRSDLGQKNTKIFLRKGLDTDLPICPSGAINCARQAQQRRTSRDVSSFRSAGIGVKSPSHIGARDGLHQFADFRFQKLIGDDERLERGANVATAHRDRFVRRSLEPVGIGRWLGRGALRHDRFRVDWRPRNNVLVSF
jgi:hypothetical protein